MAELKDMPINEVVSKLEDVINDYHSDEIYNGNNPNLVGKTIGQLAEITLRDKYNISPKEAEKLIWATNKVKDPLATDYDLDNARMIRNNTFEKIQNERTGIKVTDYSPLIPRGEGVTGLQRIIGAIIPKEDLHNYLRAQRYEVQDHPQTKRTLVRRENEAGWTEFNPNKIDIMDFIDKLPDVAEAALTGFSTTNPLIGIPAQTVIGGASDAARQYLSQQVGGRTGFDYGSIGQSAALSGLLSGSADLVGAVAKRAGPAVKEIAAWKDQVRKEAPKLLEAAKKLGFTFTKEELASSPAQRKLFDAINRGDDSIIGYFTGEHKQRKMMSQRMDQLDLVAQAILEEAAQNTGAKSAAQLKNASIANVNYGVGKEVRDAIADTIKQKKEASEFFFKRVRKALNIVDAPADLTSFERGLNKMKKDFVGSKTAQRIIGEIEAQMADGQPLSAIQNIRSDLLSAARVAGKAGDAQAAKINSDLAELMKNVEFDTYEGLINKFTVGAEKEFKSNAENAARYANKDIEPIASAVFPPNKNIAKIETADLMRRDLQSGRNLWREANQEAERYYKATGETWNMDLGPKLNKLSTEAPEKSLKRFVPNGDLEKERLMKETYPLLFERAQKATKADQVQSILNKLDLRQTRSKADWGTTLVELSKLGNDDLKILLGKESREKLKALQTVYKYAPEMINASGTKINENIMTGALLNDNSTAFKRFLLKQAYKVGNADKLAKAFSLYTTPVKQTTKAIGQYEISSEGEK